MAELLRLELLGLPEWRAMTEDMRRRAADLSPFFEFAHEVFLAEETEQFATEGAYFGAPWAPLNPRYAAQKRRRFGALPLLVRTGRLLKSVIGPGNEHVKIIKADEAVFGSTVSYGKYHQAGTPRMPQRKIIAVRDQFKKFLLTTELNYILTGRAAPQSAA